MPLITETRQWRNKSLNRPPSRVVLAIFLFVASTAHSAAQLPKPEAPPSAKAESAVPPAATNDPLGRDTPRSAMTSQPLLGTCNRFQGNARTWCSAPRNFSHWFRSSKLT
jgi:hypothetical protein